MTVFESVPQVSLNTVCLVMVIPEALSERLQALTGVVFTVVPSVWLVTVQLAEDTSGLDQVSVIGVVGATKLGFAV
jgi:hypothetical protein